VHLRRLCPLALLERPHVRASALVRPLLAVLVRTPRATLVDAVRQLPLGAAADRYRRALPVSTGRY
jgi:hypothetical protein